MLNRQIGRDFGHTDIEVTSDDPQPYTKPQSFRLQLEFLADTGLIDAVCDNQKGSRSRRSAPAVGIYRIQIDPSLMLGKPVIRNTPIPVELLLRKRIWLKAASFLDN